MEILITIFAFAYGLLNGVITEWLVVSEISKKPTFKEYLIVLLFLLFGFPIYLILKTFKNK